MGIEVNLFVLYRAYRSAPPRVLTLNGRIESVPNWCISQICVLVCLLPWYPLVPYSAALPRVDAIPRRDRVHCEQREWLAEACPLSESKKERRRFLHTGQHRGIRWCYQVPMLSPLRWFHQGTYRLLHAKQRARLGVARREGGQEIPGLRPLIVYHLAPTRHQKNRGRAHAIERISTRHQVFDVVGFSTKVALRLVLGE